MRCRMFFAFAALLASPTVGLPRAASTNNSQLAEVYRNPDFQITGVTVSKAGRLFVNFPRWSDHYLNAVVEVMPDGSARPFPDEHWNRWNLRPNTAGQQFVCVQSVVVDDNDSLWIVDPAAPLLAAVVPGGPKLVQVDLKTNTVARLIPFGPNVAKTGSYLNDVRFDNRRNTAYITDSGIGGVVVVDLASGRAYRKLDGDRSVMAEPGADIVINGKPVRGPDRRPPTFHADSIALSPDGQYLYYKPLTGVTLYRIKTDILRDVNARPQSVSAAVETVAKTFPTDGMWMDARGDLYLTGLEQNAVLRLTNGRIETVVKDPRLQWPDTLSEGPDGAMYVTTSHIHESPMFNMGKSVRKLPYGVFKFRPETRITGTR